jgi:Trypsin-like peptidase domain
VRRPGRNRMSRIARLIFSIAILLCLFGVGCGKKEESKPPTQSTDLNQAAQHTYVNQRDVLSKYSVEQLSDILKNRGNKTTYSDEPSELANISSGLIADDVVDREKAIYGPNRQKDYFEIQDPDILNAANSVAAVIGEVYLVQSGAGFQISQTCPTLGSKYHLCSKESYFNQQVPSVCTAFVVAPDVIATAGHCVPLLGSSRIVFGFRNEKNSGQVQIPAVIPASQVYRSGQVLAQKYDPAGADYALVRVDRPMIGHLPLKLHADGDIARGTFVYVLGHPSGLPEKLADGAIVNDVVSNGYFISNLDTFGGNSGSPVFNQASNTVEGILVRGGRDYGPSGNCNVSFICPVMPDGTKDCRGESATLMSQLSGALKSLSTDTQKSVSTTTPPPTSGNAPIVRTYRSGLVLSGSGAGSRSYLLVSDPPPDGYEIASFTYSLVGDRGCNAWSTCAANIEGDRVVFRFSMQGHSEWPAPGEAKSEGVLIVTFVPKAVQLPPKTWHTEDKNGQAYVEYWTMDPNCTAHPDRLSPKHRCQFQHTQIHIGESHDAFDTWNLYMDAPGPVYEVGCQHTGQNEMDDQGIPQGNTGLCTGHINGGDADIRMYVKWKQLW